jgi:hypothetical protein
MKIPDFIGLHHPLDGVTSPEYKLLHFIQLPKFFCKEKKALAFNWDRCCHLALCLRLILFHWLKIRVYELSQLQHLKVDSIVIENCQTFLARDYVSMS